MEIVFFRNMKNMNFQIIEQKMNIMKKTKYLGMVIDEHITLESHLQYR